MASLLLVTNLLHSAVACVWLAGLVFALAPIPAGLWARLLALVLVLPPVVTVIHVFAPAASVSVLPLVRADLWAEWLLAKAPVTLFGGLLLFGTVVLFVVQELVPLFKRRAVESRAARVVDVSLEGACQAVAAKYAAHGVALPSLDRLRVRLLETAVPTAAIEGFADPVLLVSRGLRERLDAHELEAVLAHELAHLVQGGNRPMFWVWVMRAFQAPNPFALVVFRLLVEAREAAADALAAEVTGKPAVLAQALLKLRARPSPADGPLGAFANARIRVQQQAELAATRLRVRTLLDGPGHAHASRTVTRTASALLAALLYAVG